MKVKNIIFDFGGVLIDLDYNMTNQRLSVLTSIDFLSGTVPIKIKKELYQYEKGEITSDQMISVLKPFLKREVESNDLIDAWNAMLIGIPAERIQFLQRLKKSYRLFLLSNTNALHIEWVKNHLEPDGGIEAFESLFEHVCYSHRIGSRKPDLETFNYILDLAQINPQETIFIDDTVEHVEGAKKAGIQGVLHDPKTEIILQLDKYIGVIENAKE